MLERFHAAGGGSLDELMQLFEASWRRSGFGDSNDELQFRERAVAALRRYWERPRARRRSPSGSSARSRSSIGPHLLRGRVDRVDRRPDGRYELIDYKTGKAKTEQELREDVQLSIYQMGARESWGSRPRRRATSTCSTGEKVPVAHSEEELERVRGTVTEIADGIMRQRFEPTALARALPASATTGSSARRPRSRGGGFRVIPDATRPACRDHLRHEEGMDSRGDWPSLLSVAATSSARRRLHRPHEGRERLARVRADGARLEQLTRDGGYSSPSQDDRGRVYAIQRGRFVRLARNGRRIGRPFNAPSARAAT